MTGPRIIPIVHDLKILPEHFADVFEGSKRAEVRKNDRGFAVGDLLTLREWIPDAHASNYTGRHCVARVTHVLYLAAGLAGVYVVLSIDVVATDGKAYP